MAKKIFNVKYTRRSYFAFGFIKSVLFCYLSFYKKIEEEEDQEEEEIEECFHLGADYLQLFSINNI